MSSDNYEFARLLATTTESLSPNKVMIFWHTGQCPFLRLSWISQHGNTINIKYRLSTYEKTVTNVIQKPRLLTAYIDYDSPSWKTREEILVLRQTHFQHRHQYSSSNQVISRYFGRNIVVCRAIFVRMDCVWHQLSFWLGKRLSPGTVMASCQLVQIGMPTCDDLLNNLKRSKTTLEM